MPAQEGSHRNLRAVLWARTGTARDGSPTYGSPVEVKVQWKVGRRDILDAQGNTITLEAMAQVGQQIAAGSKMWLGKLTDWYGTSSEGDDTEVHEVVFYQELRDLKGRGKRREVGLKKFMDTV